MPVQLPPLGNPTFSELVTRPLLSPEECAALIALNDDQAWKQAEVVNATAAAGRYDPEIRSVSSQALPLDDRWPWQRLLDLLGDVNSEVFRFRLSGVPMHDSPSILRYSAETTDHFRPHSDVGPNTATRKLTYIVQLSPPGDYSGGDLLLTQTGTHVTRDQGTLVVFPSFLHHVVSPVVRGTRHVLVGWVHGPTFA
jgi:PKHD-type hydroxylase